MMAYWLGGQWLDASAAADLSPHGPHGFFDPLTAPPKSFHLLRDQA